MVRVASGDENLIGKVCVCSLGRVGVVTGRKVIKFANGGEGECWSGIGFDGRGLWATGTGKPTAVIAEDLAAYVEMVAGRPSNFLFGQSAVVLSA